MALKPKKLEPYKKVHEPSVEISRKKDTARKESINCSEFKIKNKVGNIIEECTICK